MGDANYRFGVEIGLAVVAVLGVLVVHAAGYKDLAEVLRRDAVHLLEEGHIAVDSGLVEEAGESDTAAG